VCGEKADRGVLKVSIPTTLNHPLHGYLSIRSFLAFLDWATIAHTQNQGLGVFLYGMQYQSRSKTLGSYEYIRLYRAHVFLSFSVSIRHATRATGLDWGWTGPCDDSVCGGTACM
jgi:hypothetical protein